MKKRPKLALNGKTKSRKIPTKVFSLRLPEPTLKALEVLAIREHRTTANFVQTILLKAVERRS